MHKLLSILIFQLYFVSYGAHVSNPSNTSYQDVSAAQDSISKYGPLSAKLYKEGDLEGFKKYSNKILVIAKENNLVEFKIRALMQLAIYDQRKDKYDEALLKYIEAQEYASYLEDTSYLKIILNTNLGNCYNGMEDYDNATLTMKKVLSLAKYHSDEQQIEIKSVAMNTLALAASDQKKYAEAFNYYEQIKEILKNGKQNENILANVYLSIARCHKEQENYTEALKNSQEALRILGQKNYIQIEASAKLVIGISHYELENYTEAIQFLQSSNDIANKDGFLQIKMESHQYLAEVYEATQNINEALKEQKKYTTAKEEYLETLTNAQRLKFENDSKKTLNKIDHQQDEIDFLNQKKILYLTVGFILIILLLVFIFNYYKKDKAYKDDTSILKNSNSFLENENELLRDKLNRLTITIPEAKKIKEQKTKKESSLSIKDQEFYKEKLLNYMETSRSYLNSEIKQIDIAKELDMSSHLLSEVLATCFKQNFNSFINLYRVDEAKLLMKNPKYNGYKIIALAYESGFSSKSSFNRVFKNLVGCTPSEFQKKFR